MSKKARGPDSVRRFEEIPNIGPSMARSFKLLGIKVPHDLAKSDPYKLYVKLCEKTRSYHDPCVLDTFIAATRFMAGKENKSWWDYTEERKKNWVRVGKQVDKYKS